MCYSQGALGRFNPLERLVGEKNYRRMDPLMAASEKDLDKRLTGWFDSSYEQRQSDARVKERDTLIDANKANMYALQNPQRKTLLTGSSLSAPATSAGPGLTLLGG